MGSTCLSNLKTKLLHWEYWPTWVIYFPVIFYYFFLSLKARNFFFFSTVNPDMEMGGLYNCSKYKQLKCIPAAFKPKTLYIQKASALHQVKTLLLQANLDFPLIVKPDRGERGKGVSLVKNVLQLRDYNDQSKGDYLIQEFIDSPFEAGVFYYRFPGQTSGVIPSIVIKAFLTVTGDGTSTVKELVFKIPRARLIANTLLESEAINTAEILPAGTKKILEPIGNHNRGTRFINGNHHTNPELLRFFDALNCHLPHFHYGRFDVKAPSERDFLQAKGIKILEVNGVNAEPAHIYDPNAKFLKGIQTLLKHWGIIYTISRMNLKAGFKQASFRQAWAHFIQWKTGQ
jgi:hypothetical protein